MKMRQDGTKRFVSRSPATIASYRKRYPSLCQLAGVVLEDLTGVIRWFIHQNDRWSRSTISQYGAALFQAIEDAGLENEKELKAGLAQGPRPKKSGPRRTSARKRKSVPEDEFARLVERLRNGSDHPDDRLAARLLDHNVRLFLRPSEWLTARLDGDILTIRNGKASNGRALGSHRHLDLKDYGRTRLRDLSTLLVALRKRASAHYRFWRMLAERIARACKDVRIKRVSLYTTRHIGMANAKLRMSPEEVAATAGHKTTATATAHYAKGRTGWRTKPVGVARPTAQDVAKVIKSPKASRQEHLEYLRNRKQRTRDEPEYDAPAFGF